MVLDLAGDIRSEGAVCEVGLRSKLVDMDGERVEKLLVTPPDRTS